MSLGAGTNLWPYEDNSLFVGKPSMWVLLATCPGTALIGTLKWRGLCRARNDACFRGRISRQQRSDRVRHRGIERHRQEQLVYAPVSWLTTPAKVEA